MLLGKLGPNGLTQLAVSSLSYNRERALTGNRLIMNVLCALQLASSYPVSSSRSIQPTDAQANELANVNPKNDTTAWPLLLVGLLTTSQSQTASLLTLRPQ